MRPITRRDVIQTYFLRALFAGFFAAGFAGAAAAGAGAGAQEYSQDRRSSAIGTSQLARNATVPFAGSLSQDHVVSVQCSWPLTAMTSKMRGPKI